jgi:hypothetical protein
MKPVSFLLVFLLSFASLSASSMTLNICVMTCGYQPINLLISQAGLARATPRNLHTYYLRTKFNDMPIEMLERMAANMSDEQFHTWHMIIERAHELISHNQYHISFDLCPNFDCCRAGDFTSCSEKLFNEAAPSYTSVYRIFLEKNEKVRAILELEKNKPITGELLFAMYSEPIKPEVFKNNEALWAQVAKQHPELPLNVSVDEKVLVQWSEIAEDLKALPPSASNIVVQVEGSFSDKLLWNDIPINLSYKGMHGKRSQRDDREAE